MPPRPPPIPLFPAQANSAQANRGLAFEQAIDWQMARYRAAGWYCVRQYPPHKVTHYPIAKIVGKGPPDWIIAKAPVTIVFDAKSTVESTWPLRDLAEHQALAFDAAEKAGLIAGVLLQVAGQVWWLGWHELGPLWWAHHRGESIRGEGSLNEAARDLHGSRVEGLDFVKVAI